MADENAAEELTEVELLDLVVLELRALRRTVGLSVIVGLIWLTVVTAVRF